MEQLTPGHQLQDLAILIQPFLPKTSESIFKQLNIKPQQWKELGKTTIKQDHKINKKELLFKKLEDKEVKEFKERFQGKNSKLPIDLKVGKVLEIKDHPDADKLYVLQVDLGKEKRQLVAGLKPYYKKEELKGRNIVVVTNLEPAKLRGFESKGMLLAGDDGKNIVLVDAENSSPGDEITSYKKQITFDEFLKIKIVVKNKKVLANNQVLKEISCNIKDGSRVR